MKYLTIALLTLTACGDELESKRVEVVPTSQSEMRNLQAISACHACHDSVECYCWWMKGPDGEPDWLGAVLWLLAFGAALRVYSLHV